ncbi:mannose-1-phosphate guanylyltransferase, partial [Achromobacter xylosoxidans]
IGVYHPMLFVGVARGAAARLAPLLRQAMEHDHFRVASHTVRWVDVGNIGRGSCRDSVYY